MGVDFGIGGFNLKGLDLSLESGMKDGVGQTFA